MKVPREPSFIMTIPPYLLYPMRSNWDAGLPWANPPASWYPKENMPSPGKCASARQASSSRGTM